MSTCTDRKLRYRIWKKENGWWALSRIYPSGFVEEWSSERTHQDVLADMDFDIEILRKRGDFA